MNSPAFDNLPVAAFALDGEGKIQAWNQAMSTLTGVESTTVIGQGVRALPFGSPVRTAIFEALQGQPSAVVITGQGAEARFSVAPVKGGEGGVILMAGGGAAGVGGLDRGAADVFAEGPEVGVVPRGGEAQAEGQRQQPRGRRGRRGSGGDGGERPWS